MSLVAKYDGNCASLKAWFVDPKKQMDQKGGDLQAKKTTVYLSTSGPMVDFIKERLSLHES